jgi:hypothetical protein
MLSSAKESEVILSILSPFTSNCRNQVDPDADIREFPFQFIFGDYGDGHRQGSGCGYTRMAVEQYPRIRLWVHYSI